MNRFRTYLLSSIGLVVLVAVLTIIASNRGRSQGPATGLNVNVLNTPLPVSGNVAASVSGSVQAAESGSWNVGVTSLPAVQSQQSGVWNVNAMQAGPLWMFGLDQNHNAVQDSQVAGKLDTANGHLTGIASAAGQLSFDGSNSLKVAPQGTQNVNIVGGNLTAGSQSAGKAYSFNDTIGHAFVDPGYKEYSVDLPQTISTSTLVIWAERPLKVFLTDTINGATERWIGVIGGGECKTMNFPESVPLTRIRFVNNDLVNSPQFGFAAYGN